MILKHATIAMLMLALTMPGISVVAGCGCGGHLTNVADPIEIEQTSGCYCSQQKTSACCRTISTKSDTPSCCGGGAMCRCGDDCQCGQAADSTPAKVPDRNPTDELVRLLEVAAQAVSIQTVNDVDREWIPQETLRVFFSSSTELCSRLGRFRI